MREIRTSGSTRGEVRGVESLPLLLYRHPRLLTAAGATVPGESGGVLIVRIVARITDVALAITRLVPMEVVERPLPARRRRSPVTLTRIVAVVNVAVEAPGSMEPRARPDE
jgi:hypothetical protein